MPLETTKNYNDISLRLFIYTDSLIGIRSLRQKFTSPNILFILSVFLLWVPSADGNITYRYFG